MAKREYKVEFEFTSSRACGDNYKRVMVVKADSPVAAESAAHLRAFSRFGAAFTDNCVDWRVID